MSSSLYMYIRINRDIHICIYIYIFIDVHIYIRTCMYIHIYLCIFVICYKEHTKAIVLHTVGVQVSLQAGPHPLGYGHDTLP